MPAPSTAPGQCQLCGQPVDKSRLSSHLSKCLIRQPAEASQPSKAYVIEIKAMPYWIWVMARADAELADLDAFLREIWLECCGHLSAFTIEGEQYGSEGFDEDEDMPGMDVALADVLSLRQKFGYDYDFGSSTSLELKVISEQETRQSAPVLLLARNDAPEIVCQECDLPATVLCSACIWSGEGALCQSCAPQHDCDEALLLPVVNSPRCGVCAYTG
ncbi:MAG: hypothetical protein CVV27_15565 [Candidatus Melainabacteria bacterium HGW-Melainabacteria-1]|nr:MAG: hypothetical protein CVV27_15565 [Candidatus Melainabacteria bacterium HGW-Melainabacteria-1]